MHRTRAAFRDDSAGGLFSGPAEIEKTHVADKARNMHRRKRPKRAQGDAGKAIVVGLFDRDTNGVGAQVIPRADSIHLHAFIGRHTTPNTMVYTDDNRVYRRLSCPHGAVKHSRENTSTTEPGPTRWNRFGQC